MRISYFLLISMLMPASFLMADDMPDLSAERPGFSTPSAPVGLGVLQLEQGFTYEWARLGNWKYGTYAGPQTTIRFGVTKGLELRFSTNGYERQSARSNGQRAVFSDGTDYFVGAKLRVIKQAEKGLMPEVSVIGGVSIPAKGSAFTSGGYDPSFTLAADKDLPHKFSLIANANFASLSVAGGRNYSSGEGLWLTRSFKPISVFVESFHTTLGQGLGSEVVMDMGCYKSIGTHMQIDFEGGHTVAGVRPSMYASIGLVIRAPKALLGPDRFRTHINGY